MAAITLSSCSAFDTNNDVAVVDGKSLSQDDLQAMLESTLAQEVLQTAVIDGQVDSQSARSLITAWITQTVFREEGVGADADRVSIEAQLASDNAGTWDAAPQVMRDLYIDVLATNPVVDGGEIDVADLRTMLRVAEVSVDSRYGTWDPDRGGVVGFG
jgi:hypothetical protein